MLFGQLRVNVDYCGRSDDLHFFLLCFFCFCCCPPRCYLKIFPPRHVLNVGLLLLGLRLHWHPRSVKCSSLPPPCPPLRIEQLPPRIPVCSAPQPHYCWSGSSIVPGTSSTTMGVTSYSSSRKESEYSAIGNGVSLKSLQKDIKNLIKVGVMQLMIF